MGINRLAWAVTGHEREYCLNFEVHGHHDYIPAEVEKALQDALPDFYVMNRGSRIEIMPPQEFYLDRYTLSEDTHQHVHDTVRRLFEVTYGPIPLEVRTVVPIEAPQHTCKREGCGYTDTMIETFRHMKREGHLK